MNNLSRKHNESLKILQVNAQRSKAVVAQIRECIADASIDVILIQEPYVVAGRVRGYPCTYRVVQGDLGTCWSAIVIVNHDLTVTRIDGLCTHFATCVEIISRVGRFYLVSLYCQPSADYEIFVQYLDQVSHILIGQRYIIGMDANANSTLWGGQESDTSGVLLEEAFSAGNYMIVNADGHLPTYSSIHGESFIDITLSSSNFIQYILNWMVQKDWTTSDHRCITFGISKDRSNVCDYFDTNRFNL